MKRLAKNLRVTFHGVHNGKKIFKVFSDINGNNVFTGTMGEVMRWLPIHQEKFNRNPGAMDLGARLTLEGHRGLKRVFKVRMSGNPKIKAE